MLLVPHRTNDSKDDVDAWVWKLETWSINEDGVRVLNVSRLV